MIPTGTVEVTEAGRLSSRYIIHAVGPNLNDPSQLGLDRAMLLAFAMNNSLKMADEVLDCISLSIPAIATGSFGFPKKQCASILFQCVIKYGIDKLMNDEICNLKVIRFINNDLNTVDAFVNEYD